MKRYFLRFFGTMAVTAIISTCAFAQNNNDDDRNDGDKLDENEQIIIKKKGDKKTKVTVEIKDGEVRVNGKPLSDFKDENISVEIETEGFSRAFTQRSPFRTGATTIYNSNSDRPLLGVLTDDHEDGAKITSITKGSAAEKAGLKTGDIITRINESKIENARELTETVGKLKPEQKVTIGVKRGNKDEKLTATLGRRSDAMALPARDMNLEFDNFRLNNENFNWENGVLTNTRGRLGIRAQDTEDEKGVKVLGVEPESHAAKSGIKEGDIILQFDGEEVNSATELAEIARGAREKHTIKVRVNREGKSQDIDIKVPKKLKTANL